VTDEINSISPVFIVPSAIVLVQARAKRELSIEFETPGRAEISFSVDASEYTGEEYLITTSYEVTLLSEGKETVASMASTYLVAFTSEVDTKNMKDNSVLASLQLAAAETLHPYHRELLVQLSERFDIPAYRLDYAFDRDQFIEEVRSIEFEVE
jgi:preprotein translocase subunit SecB